MFDPNDRTTCKVLVEPSFSEGNQLVMGQMWAGGASRRHVCVAV